MKAKQSKQTSKINPKKSPSAPTTSNAGQSPTPGEERPKLPEQADSGEPGGGKGRIDVVGRIPSDIRIDPDITEGHPGYDESGPSEIIPAERFAKDKPDKSQSETG